MRTIQLFISVDFNSEVMLIPLGKEENSNIYFIVSQMHPDASVLDKWIASDVDPELRYLSITLFTIFCLNFCDRWLCELSEYFFKSALLPLPLLFNFR